MCISFDLVIHFDPMEVYLTLIIIADVGDKLRPHVSIVMPSALEGPGNFRSPFRLCTSVKRIHLRSLHIHFGIASRVVSAQIPRSTGHFSGDDSRTNRLSAFISNLDGVASGKKAEMPEFLLI